MEGTVKDIGRAKQDSIVDWKRKSDIEQALVHGRAWCCEDDQRLDEEGEGRKGETPGSCRTSTQSSGVTNSKFLYIWFNQWLRVVL